MIRWLSAVCIAVCGLSAGPGLAATSGGLSASSTEIEAPKPLRAAPVIVDGRPLFRVIGIPAYPAEKRAEVITQRIYAIAEDPAFELGRLRTEAAENGIAIVAGAQQLLVVLDADAQLEGVDGKLAARAFLEKIRDAVIAHREERSATYLWRSAAYAAGATVLLALFLWLTHRLLRRLLVILEARYQARLETLEARSLGTLDVQHMKAIFERAIWAVWWLVALVAAYGYLDVTLEYFPWTRRAARWLLDLAVDPLRIMGAAVIDSIPNLAFIAILALIVHYVLAGLRLVFIGIQAGTIRIAGFYPDWAMTTFKLVRYAVIVFAVVIAYPYIPGSSTDAFKGISVFVGVLVSLGATSIIANTLAGYALIYRRAFQVGDRVLIGKYVGDVAEVRQQVTTLHTPKNEAVVIPNSLILASENVNNSDLARRKKLILHSTVTIGYDAPWRQVEALLREAAARTPGLLKEPEPFVLASALNDFYVSYEINAYCDDASRMLELYSALHQNILDAFNEHGVQIMSPHFMAQPGDTVVVPKEKWYAPPARRP